MLMLARRELTRGQADAAGMRTYLGSTNVANRGFYASLGFRIATTFTLGGDNPSWHGKPVEFDIVSVVPMWFNSHD